MQTNFRQLPVLILALFAIIFTSCKKESKPEESTSELTAHADDQNRVSTQIDAASNDVSVALESYGAYSGRLQNPPAVFNYDDATATFDSTSNPKKITITYNGSTSSHPGFSRTGTVVVSMASGVRWKDQGAVVTVSYQNLKVTRTIDNKSITINGSHTITNVSGGLLYMLLFSSPNQSVTHIIGGSLTITFDDNTQRTWQMATRRVFTYNNGIILTITGNNAVGNIEGVAEWGVNRFGNEFTTSIKQPLVIRQDCAFRLVSGQVQHDGFGTAVATFGLDASGNLTSCPTGTNHYYFKLTWTGPNGATASATLPY